MRSARLGIAVAVAVTAAACGAHRTEPPPVPAPPPPPPAAVATTPPAAPAAGDPALPAPAAICADLAAVLDAARATFASERGELLRSDANGREYASTLRLADRPCTVVVRPGAPDTALCVVRSGDYAAVSASFDQLRPIVGGECLAGWQQADSANAASESTTYSSSGEVARVSVSLIDLDGSHLAVTVTGAGATR